MKSILICMAFVAFAQSLAHEDIEKLISQITTKCYEQQGVSVAKVEYLMDKEEFPEDDEEFITFYDCLMSGLNMYDDNNEVHFELIKGVFPEYLVKRFGSNLDSNLILETFTYCNNKYKTTPRALEAIKRRNCGLVYVKNKLSQR